MTRTITLIIDAIIHVPFALFSVHHHHPSLSYMWSGLGVPVVHPKLTCEISFVAVLHVRFASRAPLVGGQSLLLEC